jgi:carbonyl reductase 1
MGRRGAGTPPKTPEEGAKVPVRLAFGDVNGVTGKFWANENIFVTGDGKVREWWGM